MSTLTGTPLLSLDRVSKHFGGLSALADVSFDVMPNEILGLIGPNGAGKSTAINTITGFYRPDHGKVIFRGEDITKLEMHLVAHRGLVRTFQLPTFFPDRTVMEHMVLACTQSQRVSPVRIFLGTPLGRRTESSAKQRALELLESTGLTRYRDHHPKQLSTGYQRWLSLTMALAFNPKLFLLDEPFAGLSATATERTIEILKGIHRDQGVSILLIAHHVRTVMTFCDRIVVLNFGQKIADGKPADVSRDPTVIDAYLGGAEHSSESREVHTPIVIDRESTVEVKPEQERASVASELHTAQSPNASGNGYGASGSNGAETLLEVNNLVVKFGAVAALKGVSVSAKEGETIAIIGANGAGKSVLLKSITGVLKPTSGEVLYRGTKITGWPTYKIARAGVGIVPEGRRLFPAMTVWENLQLGASDRTDNKAIAADLQLVYDMFPRLWERRNQIAETLSGGEQEMVAIGRALMARARLLLLDEPSLGIAPMIVREIAEALAELQKRDGIGVVLVEQNARMALSVAHRAYVLEAGNLILHGPAQEVAASELVRRAYLGV